MIKKIRFKNYKSLRNVELKLGPRNVLIGPNMAGKSNIIDGLKFLTSLVVLGLEKTVQDRIGFSELVWKGSEEDGRVSFELNVEFPGEGQKSRDTFHYEISLLGGASAGAVPIISSEKLTIVSRNQTKTLVDLKNGQGKVLYRDGTSVSRRPIIPTMAPTVSALQLNIPDWEGTALKTWIAAWRFYRLDPFQVKKPNPSTLQKFLAENGENFSSWMMSFKNAYPEEFSLIKKVAQDVFPELEDILTPPTQFSTTVMVAKEKYLKGHVNLWSMSDGEIVFLALLSLIYAPEELGAPLFCIEEPENHLHPKLLETLVQVLTQRQDALGPTAAQVLVTTHSPLLVDKVGIDELIVVEKHNGETQCRYPSSKAHLRRMLEREELGLGDLWYSGALGGR